MSKKIYTWVIKQTEEVVDLNDWKNFIQKSYEYVGAKVVVTTTFNSYTISGYCSRGQCIAAGKVMSRMFYQYGKTDKNGIIHIFKSKTIDN